MVDDEPAGRTEAARPEMGPVAVAGQNEQVGALGGRDHLAFDPTHALLALARTA